MASPRPVVSIIVVSYNTRQMTLECLRSVAEQTTVPHELIVIDNASSDGSAEAIAAEFPEAVTIAETRNLGFAKANNFAAQRASGEYVLLLNPDTLVLDGAIDRLVAFAGAHPEAKIWGGRTVFADGSLNANSCTRTLSMWNILCRITGATGIFPKSGVFNSEHYGGWDRSTERQVDVVVGCFFLMKRADWEAMGGFDERFAMYGEETDLCIRSARELGAKPRVTPEATIVHYGGASEKVRSDKMVRLLKAKVELIKTHFPAWQKGIGVALFRLWPWSRWVATSVLSKLGRGGKGAETWGEIWRRRGEWKDGFS